MRTLLSFDQGPPISAPMRFFITAPLFAICAGALLLWSGPALFVSRWTPEALAFTHLITVGFMLQVMLGALQQLLPVIAGANIHRPMQVASVVHGAITLGAVFLVLAFLTSLPLLFGCAVVALASGSVAFIGAALHALFKVTIGNPVGHGLRLALVGLLVTVSIGLLNAVSMGGAITLALQQWTNVHMAWGFVAWGGTLLGVVGFVAVPMFQQTSHYPGRFKTGFASVTIATVSLWSAAELGGYPRAASLLAIGVVLVAASFALMTLKLLRATRRARLDAVQILWRVAMGSALAACTLWLMAQASDTVSQWPAWPLLFGALVLMGGFLSVMTGMLYKIVPFLVWLHLQNLGRGRLIAPNVKQVLAEKHLKGQMQAHGVATGLLLLAVVQPQWFVYPAGLALLVSNAWLLVNLLSALAVCRKHLAKIEALDDERQIKIQD